MPKPGPICPYCEGNPPSRLVDAGEVYGPRFAGKFNVWACVNYPGCDSYIGTKEDSIEPCGTLADKELRELRKRLRAGINAELAAMSDLRKIPPRLRPAIRQYRILMQNLTREINYSTEQSCRKVLMLLMESEVTTREK